MLPLQYQPAAAEKQRKLRKYRELKKQENLEQAEFASIMYAKAQEQEVGGI